MSNALFVGAKVRRLSRWPDADLKDAAYFVDKVRNEGYQQEIHILGDKSHRWWHADRFALLHPEVVATHMGKQISPDAGKALWLHPVTSQQAAARVQPTLTDKEQRVYEAIMVRSCPPFEGATGKEIAAFTGIMLNSVTPRLAPLRRKLCIKDSGQRRDRQIVWVVA